MILTDIRSLKWLELVTFVEDANQSKLMFIIVYFSQKLIYYSYLLDAMSAFQVQELAQIVKSQIKYAYSLQ